MIAGYQVAALACLSLLKAGSQVRKSVLDLQGVPHPLLVPLLAEADRERAPDNDRDDCEACGQQG